MKLIAPRVKPMPIDATGSIVDLRAVNQQKVLTVTNPVNAAGYLAMKQKTTARLGLGRIGTRYTTRSVLRLRADHAAAKDAVWTDVSADFIHKMGWLALQSTCKTETEYLTRPDHGRIVAPTELDQLKPAFPTPPRVLLAVGDGLSSSAIEANAAEVIPAIKQGLALSQIQIGTIPFIRFARVAVEDYLGEATQADVVCLLIGERPGLATAKSMSAYIVYRPIIGMPEARRTVVSNIHPNGVPAVEAGAYIAGVIKEMLAKQVSGIALKAVE
ncbi:ethanolamine ammonia-lyase subunit EutC [Secundilactobacillus silagei]|uniref:Ethanolamine ammonia-lyase small subunit n=1 Tax=Secundilactobacillus silagei JCM 19001 TaxID=1302250 RepID=A0A1Z5II87_9LACO|nr:ethanolamine ammonia-lyase subunit EutC [Secundilactobacillus silagei]TDG73118.1 hypothetical protein C5L25_000759 [Secundilactobacillus silagei JCM 19001]GAX01477.1 ethanolamine ammonia-lyase light chain [Secundilactobacillus silagei JCM 19001]